LGLLISLGLLAALSAALLHPFGRRLLGGMLFACLAIAAVIYAIVWNYEARIANNYTIAGPSEIGPSAAAIVATAVTRVSPVSPAAPAAASTTSAVIANSENDAVVTGLSAKVVKAVNAVNAVNAATPTCRDGEPACTPWERNGKAPLVLRSSKRALRVHLE
jgi:hypothetical protein